MMSVTIKDVTSCSKCVLLQVILYFSFFSLINGAIQSPPTIVKQPPHEQLYQVAQSLDETDRPFMLECEAQGNPEPKYRWIKNGLEFDYVAYDKRISQQPRRGTLVFTKPDHVDEGLYQCFAENIHGVSVSNSVFLRKSELNSFPDEDPRETLVNEGDPLSIDCSPPTGYPKPSIFWIILSSTGALRSINSSRLTVDPEGQLHFSNVTRQDMFDDAMYACSATSVFRTEYKVGRRTILKVEPSGSSGQSSHPPIRHYVSPPNIPALRGQKLELHCIFGGTPLPDVIWRKRSGSLEGNRYTYINYGKTLQILRVDYSDEGTYECTASNGIGSQISHAMHVTVQSAPFWITAPNNTNAAEDESVRFECIASGTPEPKLQWFVNGVPIEKAPTNRRRKVEGNVLTIDKLLKPDTAVYQCNASNVHGYAFRDYYLNVLALPPTITDPPEKVTKAVVTSTVRLRCRVFGAPKPEIKWRKQGLELTGGRYQVLESGDLEISSVLVTDQGDYQCYAVNKFGDAAANGELAVKGKTKITHPPENFEVAAGKMAVFRCNAEADPSLVSTIEWLFNGKSVDYDHDPRMVQATDNSLTITTTKELDSGIYTCVAKTELDQVTADATLIVQDVPNPPQIIGIDCDGLAALVEWMPMGDRRAPILSYSIQYNTSFAPNNWEVAFAHIPAPDTRFKVQMSPWANYTFRVIARNKIGPSVASSPSERCSTEEDVPHDNPENVVGRGDTPTNLVISWTRMPPIKQNAPGFFYRVYWKRNDDQHASWESKNIYDWEQNRFAIENQPTFKPYRIKVEAHNRRGQAHVQATEIIGYSGENVPLYAPQNFALQEIRDARSALLSWNPVTAESVRGHFRGYKIQTWTREEGEKHMREVVVPPNVTRALVQVFKPFSRNIVQVLAFNDAHQGPPSNQLLINTPEGVPGPVFSFNAIPMGSSALYLVWTPPEEPNGNLTGYRIYYEEVIGTQLGPKLERQPSITDPNKERAKLAGLKPATKYRISIHATTSKGQGEPYYIEEETRGDEALVPDVPEFYVRPLLDEEGKSGVRVTWLPKTQSGRPGSHFYVQFRRKGEGQWVNTPKEESQDSIQVKGLDQGTTYEMRVVAVDGTYETPSNIEEITTGGLGSGPDATDHLAKFADWFIGMMCAIALVIVLAVLVFVVKRNRGGKYSVHEKEIARGRDIDYDEGGGFNEYNKPLGPHVHRGSRQSLTNSVEGPGESDTDSMAEYGEGDSSKFGEDGSFIGQYGAKKRNKEDPQSPTGIATFV